MLTYEYYVVVKTVLKCLQVVNPGVILGSDVFDEKLKIITMLKKKNYIPTVFVCGICTEDIKNGFYVGRCNFNVGVSY